MKNFPIALSALTLVWMVSFPACAVNSEQTLGFEQTVDAGGSFQAADAALQPPERMTSYCPSNTCPTGWTACPDSRFPCDVNFQNDRNNCGACGNICPQVAGQDMYECVEGRCVLQCNDILLKLDCDGIPDNGCEANGDSNDSCGACGKKCLDPQKPCESQSVAGDYDCGCPNGWLFCPESPGAILGSCVDAMREDANCGACGVACDRAGDGGPSYPNTYYGCVGGECDQLKCEPGWSNCDDDISNGCETSLLSRDDCGACGNTCSSAQECRADRTNTLRCMCEGNNTFCPLFCDGDFCWGECHDLATDTDHCGACDVSCESPVSAAGLGTGVVIAACKYGTCTYGCPNGRADCNGSTADDCEVNTDSDPQNCGACGRVCDAIAGQACVGGECVVEPCNEADAGGVEAR